MIARLVLFFAAAGTVTSSIFFGMVLVAARRFLRATPRESPRATREAAIGAPPVTVLKPVHGDEPRLRENLESFFLQEYPTFEIVFGARNAEDPAVAIIREVSRKYPHVSTQIVLSGDPPWANAKVYSLEKMIAAAAHRFLVISDSDVHVAPDYLREIVRPLLGERVGLVTCLYRGVPVGGLWSTLEALGMSVEMTSGVLVANMIEGMKFALGPTMATRRECLERIGGIRKTADYYSDDYELGRLIHEAGYNVVLSRHMIEHLVLARSFKKSLAHQIRWMRSTRYSRPRGHVGTGLTFAMPYALLGLAGGIAFGNPPLGFVFFGWGVLNRVLLALVVGWGVVRDRRALAFCWLYPLRDLLGFALWCGSFRGGTFLWRGERYQFQRGGRILAERSARPADSAGLSNH
jgi:ceramide glucosyltransferase